jgi:hypothetical protein
MNSPDEIDAYNSYLLGEVEAADAAVAAAILGEGDYAAAYALRAAAEDAYISGYVADIYAAE